PSAEWKTQLSNLESALEAVKKTNTATLAPLKKSLAAWSAGIEAKGTAAALKQLSDQANKDAGVLDQALHGAENLALSGSQELKSLQETLEQWSYNLRHLETILDEWVKHTAWKASLAEGNELFQVNCASCHNFDGRGGMIGVQEDSWGFDVLPRNLTRNVYRGGNRPIDFYWRISGGITGSGMQAFKLEPAQKWAIINHVRNLATTEGRK
ncbi:MAG: cytochrome c, partial [Planctomycetota bacterium]|nr:cytochrome c [Planctomycetota bacterium]